MNEDPFEYNRIGHFERSASFGFEQDKLGRLNEINHDQVQEVLRGSHYANFRHTNHNFMNNFKGSNISLSRMKMLTQQKLMEENGPKFDFGDPYETKNYVRSLERNKNTIGSSYGALHGS